MKNPRPHLPSLTILTLLAAFVCIGQGLNAATLISYGPSNSYVSADETYARTATMTGSGPYVDENAFSDSSALSPSSNYTGPAFYGGYVFTSSDIPSGFTREQIRNDYTGLNNDDSMFLQTFRAEGWATGTFSFAAVYLFKQEDFNAPYNDGSITLDGLSLTYYENTSGSPTDRFDPTGRWLVQIADIYYLSEATITGTPGAANTITINESELNATQWAVYDPSTSLFFDAGSASFDTISLSGVTSVGVYFDDDDFNGIDTGVAVVSFGVSEFEATGIPEPTSATMLLAVFALITGCHRTIKRRPLQ